VSVVFSETQARGSSFRLREFGSDLEPTPRNAVIMRRLHEQREREVVFAVAEGTPRNDTFSQRLLLACPDGDTLIQRYQTGDTSLLETRLIRDAAALS
jgi:hypothetical protein